MRFSLVIIVLLYSLEGLAAPTWHTSTIRSVYPLSDGSVVLTFDSDSPNCSNASDPDYYYIRVGQNGMTSDGLKLLYAAALTAFTTGSRVSINYDDATTGCYINRLNIIDPI